jgi:uncharacterized metal-binding protein
MLASLPILFACSGCSNAGQLANHVALEMSRWGIAEMSCIAGIGAGKSHFLKQLARRRVWVIDGCPIHCGLGVLQQAGNEVDAHIRLHEMGVRKDTTMPDTCEVEKLIDEVLRYIKATEQTPE